MSRSHRQPTTCIKDAIGIQKVSPTARSVSLLQAHAAVPQGAFSRANYQGTPKTYLNEVDFTQYRRFGSETRILSGDSDPPAK